MHSNLDYFGLPNVAAVFREKVEHKELFPPHAHIAIGEGKRPQFPVPMPGDSGDLWIEPFPCQKKFRSLNSRRTCRLIENLAALIAVWRHEEIFRHLHCEYESCAFYRSYVDMMLWTAGSVSCLQTHRERCWQPGM